MAVPMYALITVRSPKSCAFPVVVIVIKSIVLCGFPPLGSLNTPEINTRVDDDNPEANMATLDKSPYGLICEIMNDDGTMARLGDLVKFCKKHKLKMSSIKDLIEYKVKKEKLVKCIRMETFKYGHLIDFKLFIYKNIIDGTELIALLKGKVLSNQNIVFRVINASFL